MALSNSFCKVHVPRVRQKYQQLFRQYLNLVLFNLNFGSPQAGAGASDSVPPGEAPRTVPVRRGQWAVEKKRS